MIRPRLGRWVLKPLPTLDAALQRFYLVKEQLSAKRRESRLAARVPNWKDPDPMPWNRFQNEAP